jgi:hypothetical protein
MLLVRPVYGHRVHTGDVAVFLKDGKLTAHRLIFAFRFCARAFLLEMGDANRGASLLDQRSVLGRVDAIEREGSLIQFAYGTRNEQGRRVAYHLRWRLLATRLPSGRLRKMLGV